jgi:hypothetical protein
MEKHDLLANHKITAGSKWVQTETIPMKHIIVEYLNKNMAACSICTTLCI